MMKNETTRKSNCLKCGLKVNFHAGCYGVCHVCELCYCGGCGEWMSAEKFRGHHRQFGNNCANCRDKKDASRKRKQVDNISPRLRFAILQRDGFTCRYCGRKAPHVVLHIDHIIPVSKGGRTEAANLITACEDCNRGKADILLTAELIKLI